MDVNGSMVVAAHEVFIFPKVNSDNMPSAALSCGVWGQSKLFNTRANRK